MIDRPIEFGGPAADGEATDGDGDGNGSRGSLKMHTRMGQRRSVGRGCAASTGVPRPEVLARDTFGFPADVAGVHSTLHPRKGVTMSELKNRMIQDLKLAGLVEGTSEAYLRAVHQLATCYMIPPDQLPERVGPKIEPISKPLENQEFTRAGRMSLGRRSVSR